MKRVAVFLIACICSLAAVSCAREAVYFSVSFSGAKEEISSVSVMRGDTLTLPDTRDPEGFYAFGGWYMNTAFNGAPLTSVKPAADTTLYAKWTPLEFTVTYALNGGTYAIATETFTCESPVTFGRPEKPGYTFDGWYADADFSRPLSDTTGLNRDLTVYAAWTAPVPPAYFTFTLRADGTYSAGIREGAQVPERITVPHEYESRAVTAIAESGFAGAAIKEVVLYDNIKEIGARAFYGSKLASVNLEHVERIGDYAFSESALVRADLVSAAEVGDYAFLNISSLAYLLFAGENLHVGASAFSGCGLRSLVSLSVKPPVLEVSALPQSEEPFHIYVPGASYAAYEGTPCWSVYYPLGRLHDIACIEGDFAIKQDAPGKVRLLQYFGGAAAVLPDKVTEIGNYAFARSGAEEVSVGEITRIGEHAFDGCTLATLTILSTSVPQLGAFALPSDGFKIRVPEAMRAAYLSAEAWTAYTDLFEFIPDTGAKDPVQ